MMNESKSKLIEKEDEVQVLTPKAYVLEFSDPRFTFKNFFVEYARFHMEEK